jgi:hypothetical protein
LYRLKNFQCANENLNYFDGYGNANICDIDGDTNIKRSLLTHDRARCALNTRTFVAVPSMDHGGLIPDVDTKIKSGGFDAGGCQTRCPAYIAEADYSRFTPLVKCVQPRAHNPKLSYTITGKNSRDVVRSDDWLQACGYEHKNGVWTKKR